MAIRAELMNCAVSCAQLWFDIFPPVHWPWVAALWTTLPAVSTPAGQAFNTHMHLLLYSGHTKYLETFGHLNHIYDHLLLLFTNIYIYINIVCVCVCVCVCAYTLTGQFIRYTLLVPGWTLFCLQNCFNSSWHRLNKVLETLLRDFGPYWHDSITQLLQICRLHIHDANLSFHHIPKVLYWIEIWWRWRPFE